MKFEYDEDRERDEAMAYIDQADNLRISDGNGLAIVLKSDGTFAWNSGFWEPDITTNKRRFYRGDKLTITF